MNFAQLPHGGDLAAAVAEFGEPEGGWIDLSTGISPWPWPVPPVPEDIWRRLPQSGDALTRVAAGYYRCAPERLLAVPGSQRAISLLPALFKHAAVAVPRWGYLEHERAWRAAGHTVTPYDSLDHLHELLAAHEVRNAVAINPNNPTAELLRPRALGAIADRLAARDGWLVVDEAFADAQPACSLIALAHPAIVVLRSLGKFFGLAGIRLGFIAAPPDLIERCAARLEPWAVSHPARWVGTQALADRRWQHEQRARLRRTARAWRAALATIFPDLCWRRTALFATAITSPERADAMRQAAGRRGVLIRVYPASAGQAAAVDHAGAMLRLGLPHPDEIAVVQNVLRSVADGS
jgi:cobalamin biosynthetic protein CobC